MKGQIYPDAMKVQDALLLYFDKYHFKDGGYKDKYFKIKIGPFKIPVPNTQSRLKAVKFHDIHHLLTEYNALWKGEIEIAAWEIASGCGPFFVAWFLNFGSLAIGIWLYPRALYRAFMRGRNVRTNLYHGYRYDGILLSRSLGELRIQLGMDYEPRRSAHDLLYFLVWLMLVLLFWLGIVLVFYFFC